MQSSLNQLFFIDNHVISQIIKSKFIIRYISNIAIISLSSLVIVHLIENNTDFESQKLMYFSHPLSITLCQIVIDCNNVNSFSIQGIQISRKCRHKCLSFTCSHLCDTSLMQDNSTDQLYSVVAHSKASVSTFSYYSICFRKNIIQSLSFFQALFEFFRLSAKLFI